MKPANAKERREAKLFEELCAKFGYVVREASKGKRVQMFYERNNGKPMVRAHIVAEILVPSESVLGKALQEAYGMRKPETIADVKAKEAKRTKAGAR